MNKNFWFELPYVHQIENIKTIIQKGCICTISNGKKDFYYFPQYCGLWMEEYEVEIMKDLEQVIVQSYEGEKVKIMLGGFKGKLKIKIQPKPLSKKNVYSK